jgi:hypothetical protein
VFCKLTADTSWTTLAFAPGAFSAVDVAYQNRAFYLVSHYGRVAVFDLVSPLRKMPTRRDALHALAHTWDGQCLVQRHGGEMLMAAWSGGGRELAVFKLGSDGWWTEAGDDVSEDLVVLSSPAAVACWLEQGKALRPAGVPITASPALGLLLTSSCY